MTEKTTHRTDFDHKRNHLDEAETAAPQKHRMQGALQVKPVPFPWGKALGSGLSTGAPILLGALAGHLDYGLMASIGGFSYLYGVNEPYRRRAKKVLLVLLLLALSLGIGSLGAGFRWSTVLAVGLVGWLAFYSSGALQVAPPGGFFFVMACATGTGMPYEPDAVWLRMLLIVAGGLLAWLFSMAGWLIRPFGPETSMVVQAYRQLAAVLEAVGTPRYQHALHQAALALRAAKGAVQSRQAVLRPAREQARLQHFAHKAEELFIAVIQVATEHREADGSTKEHAAALRMIAQWIASPKAALSPPSEIAASPSASAAEKRLCDQFQLVCSIDASGSEPQPVLHSYRRPSLWAKLAASFDSKSLVLPMSIRFGVMLMLATSIAYSFGIHRPYWVPLSCAAVMVGTSGMAALQRAMQRFGGTVLGMLLGNLFLGLHPQGLTLAAAVMALQFIVELVIGRNYGFAVLFITPLALIMAEAGHPEYSASYYVTARLADIFLGCLLGLLGTMLLGQRAASDRLPAVIAHTLLREEELLQCMAEGKPLHQARHHLQTALIHTWIVYDASLNELIRRKTGVEAMWPAVASVQRLGYVLLGLSGTEPVSLSTETKQRLQQSFFALALAFEHRCAPEPIAVPELCAYPDVKRELQAVWARLSAMAQGGQKG